MAKQNLPPKVQHICDECKLKRWKEDERYMTPDRQYIFIRCPHYRNGEVSIIRGTPACKLFKQ